ncbi:hypothetical protein PBI_BEAGLE_9 [Arthrobacter phage Beagle]|nr:hypothetical protein PBI_BEAGLE_9 [Arthrobacter phage Beagle]
MNLVVMDEVAEYYSAIPAPTYDPFKATKAWLSSHAFLIGGRGHGKVYAQKVALREYQRHSALSRHLGKIPSVDVAKIRWRCRPPSSPPGSRGSFQDMLGEMLVAMDNSGRFARMQEVYQQMYDARNSVNDAAPSVVDNVNVVTDRIPPHIAALPEPEQGPALVEAIFERKRRAGK